MATFPQITSPPQALAEVLVNEALETLEHQAVYGKKQGTTTGLTWGYYGGRWGGFAITAGTFTLTDNSANYIVVERATGVSTCSTSATNWSNTTDYARVYKVTTLSGVVSAVEDHRGGPGGVSGGGGGSGSFGTISASRLLGRGSAGGSGDPEEITLGAGISMVGTTLSTAAGTGAVIKQTQVGSAGLALVGDGTLRDPRELGAGTFTVGTIATITDDSLYNAWPVVCRLRNRQLLLCYTAGNGHHSDNSAVAVTKYGSENLDGTVTWGSGTTILSHASLGVYPYGVVQISTGRIIVSLWRDNYAVANSGEAGYIYSDDDGATWTAWQDLSVASAFTSQTVAEASAVELDNGDVLITVGGIDGGQTYLTDASVKVLRSTDGGTSFGSPVYIHHSTSDSTPVFETTLCLLRDRTILAVHRNGTSASAPHYTQRSTDGGATWSAKAASPAGYGKPNVIQTSTGTVLYFTRQATTKAVVAYVSIDGGLTWDAGTSVDATMYESEYACPVELLNGKVMAVYGHQPTSSFSNCDVKSAMLTEDTAHFKATDVAKAHSTTIGRHSVPVVSGAMRPSSSGGCAALALVATSANEPDISSLDFDAATEEYAQFIVPMPKSWDEGTVTATFVWSHAATTTNYGVVWGLQGVARSDGDAVAAAYGTGQTATDTGGTTDTQYVSPETSAITIAGSPAAEDIVHFRVYRKAADGSDTLAIDARLHAVVLYITTDAENDA